jgi:hypothetical protein
VVFRTVDMSDYITKLFKTQEEVILNHVNPNVIEIGQEARED